ncbi:hypothetical protein JDS79_43030, partial [Bacillus cereus]|nr:hypothetical protein [Bacillus cereus]
AKNRSGTGKDTSIKALTQPDSAVKLAAEDDREHDDTLIWPPVDGANQYKVKFIVQIYYCTEPRVVVCGLTGGRNYDFQVSSGNSSG